MEYAYRSERERLKTHMGTIGMGVISMSGISTSAITECTRGRVKNASYDDKGVSMGIAVVTGASSGLGRAYAKRFDRKEGVDEIWLVARRRDRLEELAASLATPRRIIVADLSTDEGLETLREALAETEPDIHYLVNAAGFAKFGYYSTVAREDSDGMVNLNCRAVVDVTTMCLPYMQRGARILNVASCAGFVPLQGMSVYAATKAFVVSYSRSLRWELFPRGIVVTAVCPAWMKTEFMEVGRRGHEDRPSVRHYPFAQKPETVAALSLVASRIGISTATCGIPALVVRFFGKLLPNCIPQACWEPIRRL